MTIVSIDFETANYSDASICEAGMAVAENGKIIETPYWLVRPPKGHGWFLEEFTENCHGLTHLDVLDAPEFPTIAPEFLDRLTRADLVIAHNAPFDMGKLRGTLQHFRLACPEFEYACTLQLSRRVWPDLPAHDLKTVATHIGHDFQHHHARSDAETAARVMLAMMQHTSTANPRELLRKTGLSPKQFPVN
jgi:DNA polymerase-3 subunit epsilon